MENPVFQTPKELEEALIALRDARDWKRFHSPRQLTSAIAIETGELLELFLWKTDTDVEESIKDNQFLEKVGDEIADVLSFTILLSNQFGFDFMELIRKKLIKNNARYPVEKCKGISTKYTDLT